MLTAASSKQLALENDHPQGNSPCFLVKTTFPPIVECKCFHTERSMMMYFWRKWQILAQPRDLIRKGFPQINYDASTLSSVLRIGNQQTEKSGKVIDDGDSVEKLEKIMKPTSVMNQNTHPHGATSSVDGKKSEDMKHFVEPEIVSQNSRLIETPNISFENPASSNQQRESPLEKYGKTEPPPPSTSSPVKPSEPIFTPEIAPSFETVIQNVPRNASPTMALPENSGKLLQGQTESSAVSSPTNADELITPSLSGKKVSSTISSPVDSATSDLLPWQILDKITGISKSLSPSKNIEIMTKRRELMSAELGVNVSRTAPSTRSPIQSQSEKERANSAKEHPVVSPVVKEKTESEMTSFAKIENPATSASESTINKIKNPETKKALPTMKIDSKNSLSPLPSATMTKPECPPLVMNVSTETRQASKAKKLRGKSRTAGEQKHRWEGTFAYGERTLRWIIQIRVTPPIRRRMLGRRRWRNSNAMKWELAASPSKLELRWTPPKELSRNDKSPRASGN